MFLGRRGGRLPNLYAFWERRIISAFVLPSTTDWTGDQTLKLFTRRGWTDYSSWGSSDPSACTARCWRSFISLWWPVYFSLLWFVGGAASEPETPIDSTKSLRRLALWLVVHRKLWRLWWRGGHWKNCYPSWIILSPSPPHSGNPRLTAEHLLQKAALTCLHLHILGSFKSSF